MSSHVYKLTYFKYKALAEPIRILFAYVGVHYEDIRIDWEEWPAIKEAKGWETLPVLEIGVDKELTQSGTILRYLAKVHNLDGENDFENGKCDEIIDAFNDFRYECYPFSLCQDEDKKETLKQELLKITFPRYLKIFNEIVERNPSGFLVGKKMTYADIFVASYIEIYEDFWDKDLLKSFPGLKAHQTAVFTKPCIREWIKNRPISQW